MHLLDFVTSFVDSHNFYARSKTGPEPASSTLPPEGGIRIEVQSSSPTESTRRRRRKTRRDDRVGQTNELTRIDEAVLDRITIKMQPNQNSRRSPKQPKPSTTKSDPIRVEEIIDHDSKLIYDHYDEEDDDDGFEPMTIIEDITADDEENGIIAINASSSRKNSYDDDTAAIPNLDCEVEILNRKALQPWYTFSLAWYNFLSSAIHV